MLVQAWVHTGHRVLMPRGTGCWDRRAAELVEEMCRGAEPALHVSPRAGRALVFQSAWVNGSADPVTWHAGCRAAAGSKFTLQKFKEHPGNYIV